MSRSFFITATGTGQGKTLVTAALCYQLRKAGQEVRVLKPVLSGYDDPATSDSGILLKSMGQPVTEANIDAISPWRFKASLSPDLAAAREGREIVFEELAAFCQPETTEDFLLIEGAGGVLSPLTARHTNLDLIAALGCPAILVSASYLGCISHILTAISVLQSRGIPMAGLVVSEAPENRLEAETVMQSLVPHLPRGLPVQIIKKLEGGTDLWNTAPDLTALVTGDA